MYIDEPPFFRRPHWRLCSLTWKEARSCTTPPPPPELGIRNHGWVVSEPWSKGEGRLVDLVNPKLKNCCACGSLVARVGGDPLNSAGSSKGGPIYAPRGPSGTQNIRIIELNNDQQLWLKSKWWIFERLVCLLPYKVMKHIQTDPNISKNHQFPTRISSGKAQPPRDPGGYRTTRNVPKPLKLRGQRQETQRWRIWGMENIRIMTTSHSLTGQNHAQLDSKSWNACDVRTKA